MHFNEYWRATGISVIFYFAIYLYYPIISQYVKSIGLDDFQVGLVFSVMPFVVFFASAIIGRISDEIGRTRIIIFGLIVEIFSMVLYLIGGRWYMFAFAQVLNAIAYASVAIVSLVKVEDSVSDGERGRFGGQSLSMLHIGIIAGPIIGGFLADTFFIKAPFLLNAIILLSLAFMLVFRSKVNNKRIKQSNFNIFTELKEFWAIKPLRGMAILGIVNHASKPAMTIFLPLYLIEKLGFSFTLVGVAAFFLGVTHLFQFYFGKVADDKGYINMIMLGCFLYALFMFFIPSTTVFWLLLVILFLQGVGSSIWNVSAWSFLSHIGEKMHSEGMVAGSYMSIAKIGTFVSFLFSGLVVQVFGFKVLFMFNAFLIAIGMLIAAFYMHTGIFSNYLDKHF